MTRVRPVLLLLLAMVALAACAYRGPEYNLLLRRASWFSYLNGDDIRAACRPGAADRYRLVYNADYVEQVRFYDIETLESGETVLRQAVDRGLTIDRFNLFDPLSIGAPVRAERPLLSAVQQELGAALAASGAFESPPAGLRLSSGEYFWLVVGCRDGQVFFNAYRLPSARFAAIRFDEVLRRLDTTGVPWPDPQAALRSSEYPRCRDRQRSEGYVCFPLEVGEDGLAGYAAAP